MCRPGPNKKVIIVYTDSQGLITVLQKGPVRQRDAQLASIWKSIYVLHRKSGIPVDSFSLRHYKEPLHMRSRPDSYKRHAAEVSIIPMSLSADPFMDCL